MYSPIWNGTRGIGSWTLLTTPTAPSPRFAMGFTDDLMVTNIYEHMVLFGGCGTSCPLNDTWTFDSTNWKNVTNAIGRAPSPRFAFAFAASEQNFSVIGAVLNATTLFGGCASSLSECRYANGSSAALNDTWQFIFSIPSGGFWRQTISSQACIHEAFGFCPSPRYFLGSEAYFPPYIITTLSTHSRYGTLLSYGGIGPGGITLGDASENGSGFWIYRPVIAGNFLNDTWARYSGLPYYVGYNKTTGTSNWPAWTVPFSPLGPPASRYDPTLVGIPSENGTLMFGGSGASGSSLGDTWWANATTKQDFSGWMVNASLLWPVPVPSAMFGGSMVFDYALNHTVLFGGCGVECGNATTWNYTAGKWMPWIADYPLVNKSNSPPPRFNASMVYFNKSSGGQPLVVLFGGIGRNGAWYNDTWNFTANQWTRISPQFNRAPSPRQGASFAYNSSFGEAVLYGGCGPITCPLNDTWHLSRGIGNTFTWTVTGTLAPGRYGASMTYDPQSKRIVLFGGCGTSCPLNETWTFNDVSGTWWHCTLASCSGRSAPPARWGAAITYYPAGAYDLLFGGCGAGGLLNDTWTFSGLTWTNLGLSRSPPSRCDASVSNDTRGGYVLLFGGMGDAGKLYGDLGWAYESGQWYPMAIGTSQIPSATSVEPRFGASLAYNSTGNYVLLVGGCGWTGVYGCGGLANHNDTWKYVNGSWKWICSSCGPSPRWHAGFVFDPPDNEFVLFGGCAASSSASCSLTGRQLGETWKFGTNRWTSLRISGPTARGDPAMSFDPSSGFIVLFGGTGCTAVCSDTWTFHGGTWSGYSATTHPSARFGSAIAPDTGDGYMLLFGGQDSSGNVLNDTWKFTLSSGWTHLGSTGPVAVYDAGMSLDPVHNLVVLVGGAPHNGSLPVLLAWTFAHGIWTSSFSLPQGLGRWGFAMVYDQTAGPAGYFLVFGGSLGPAPAPSQGAGGRTDIPGSAPSQGDSWALQLSTNPGGTADWVSLGLTT